VPAAHLERRDEAWQGQFDGAARVERWAGCALYGHRENGLATLELAALGVWIPDLRCRGEQALVAPGATSKEVPAELFVSPRIGDAHLRSTFGELSIASRRELRNRTWEWTVPRGT
jgi:hypothetical protein